ncbi:hypothetical protein KUTeg_021185 [Tegillarca granosa]|uniref:Purple acid phosphatase C-terminal domain-containing protein n=1 Tax=Tegillarca granosa TaxID=220873 RepID=A0ABQ9EA37_TEGGR|nr:hypothetical protein KUTeg_021185 [Tegillarca granosa]
MSLNYLDPKATVQIIIGTMGNQYLSEFSTKPGGAWSAKTISDIDKEMYVRLTVYNATHLYWEALNARDNSVLDKVLIVQRVHGAFSKKAVYIPDPLQGVEGLEQQNSDKNTFNIINFKFLYIYDDYHSRITVLTFTLIILVIGIIMRKKMVHVFGFCYLTFHSSFFSLPECNTGNLTPKVDTTTASARVSTVIYGTIFDWLLLSDASVKICYQDTRTIIAAITINNHFVVFCIRIIGIVDTVIPEVCGLDRIFFKEIHIQVNMICEETVDVDLIVLVCRKCATP